jgi:hypothetical protein
MSDTAPSPPAKKPNAIQAAWRRFKDRLKLTWIGWLYICARRTLGGSVLLVLLPITLIVVLIALFAYLSFRPYASWDELPCQTGTLVKVHSVTKGESIGRLVDEAGVEHKFYGRGLFGHVNNARITSYLGQELKLCYLYTLHVLPPFYMREARFAHYPDGTSSSNTKTIDEARAEAIRGIEITLLWFTLPLLLWLLKRHGREAWRERQAHLLALSKPTADANSHASPPSKP